MPWKPLTQPVPWQAFELALLKSEDPDDSVQFPPPSPANYQAQLFFNIGLREVLNPASLDSLPYGWRFLAPNRPQVGDAFAVYLNDAGAVTGLSYGDGINRAQEASAHLEERPPIQIGTDREVDASVYEVWVLRINGLSVEGFWLHSTGPNPDLIVPYLTLGATFHNVPLDARLAYPLTEFLGQLAAQAKDLLAVPPAPPYRPKAR